MVITLLKKSFYTFLLFGLFASLLFTTPVYAQELSETESLDGIQKKVTPIEPNVNSDLPESATDEQREAAEQIINSQEGIISFTADFLEAFEIIEKMSDEELAAAVTSLKEALGSTEGNLTGNDVAIHVCPYLDMKVQEVKVSEADYNGSPEITLDISMKYDLIVSKKNVEEICVTGENKNAVVLNGEQQSFTMKPGSEVAITLPLPEVFSEYEDIIIVKHIKDEETFYYYDTTVDDVAHTMTFINPNGFSQFIFQVDNRTAGVNYQIPETTGQIVFYRANDVNIAEIPTAEKAGHIFQGWKYEELEGIYTGKITNDLLTKLSEVYVNIGGRDIIATPVFIPIPASDDDERAEDVEDDEPQLIETQVAVQDAEKLSPATGDSSMVLFYVVLALMALVPVTIICAVCIEYHWRRH